MLGSKILAVASVVLGASALPVANTADNSGNYTVTIINKCADKHSFGAFQIAQPSFQMSQITKTLDLGPKENGTLSIPFNMLGVRVSNIADQPIGNQWQAKQLVEFGVSSFLGMIGTAYDLSMMNGADNENALSVCPDKQTATCKCKHIEPEMPMAQKLLQAWLNPNQKDAGSLPDTTCMSGKQDYTITWC